MQRHDGSSAVFMTKWWLPRMRAITNPHGSGHRPVQRRSGADFGSCRNDDALNTNELQISFGEAFHVKA
jgi:hypothetical protein